MPRLMQTKQKVYHSKVLDLAMSWSAGKTYCFFWRELARMPAMSASINTSIIFATGKSKIEYRGFQFPRLNSMLFRGERETEIMNVLGNVWIHLENSRRGSTSSEEDKKLVILSSRCFSELILLGCLDWLHRYYLLLFFESLTFSKLIFKTIFTNFKTKRCKKQRNICTTNNG